ncbi:MAG: hypothetical protein GY930_21295 [bacterium]|nr:hypothetical protein [bacterium]
MFFSTLTLALCSTLPIQEPAPQPEIDFSGLIPASAVIIVRLESTEALLKTAQSITRVFSPGSPELPANWPFTDLNGIDVKGLDASRPFYICWTIDHNGFQSAGAFPANDSKKVVESLANEGFRTKVRDDWVGFSSAPTYATTGTNEKVKSLLPGVVSAHIDLAALVTNFGHFVEIGLASARDQMINAMEQTPSPMDMEAVFDLYFDCLQQVVQSAESLDIALIDQGEQLTLHGSYRAKEGSALAGLMDPLPLPATLPVAIPSDAPISYVMVANMGALFTKFSPLFEDILEIYPEDLRDPLAEYMGMLPRMLKGFGNTTVGFGGFYSDGLKFDYFSEYQGDEEFAEVCKSMAAEANSYLAGMGSSIGEPSQVEIDGIQVTQMPITLDYDKLNAIFSTGLDQGPGSDQLMDWMKIMYGEKPVVSMAQLGDRIWLHIGDAKQPLQQGVALLKAGPAPTTQTFAALPGLPTSAHPFITYRMEMVSLMKALQPMLETSGLQFELPDTPLNMTTWMGINGRDFIGGFSIKPTEVKAFFDTVIGESPGNGSMIEPEYVGGTPPTVTHPKK